MTEPRPCPTPLKGSYYSEGRARRGAQKLARRVIAEGDHFDPVYAYRCICGALHLTRLAVWEGVQREVLYEIAEHLQAFALERPEPDDA